MQLVPVESTEKVKMNDFGIMQRYLGNTDLLVSECCLGGMTWGDQNTEADAETQLNFAFDNGVNFLDTAEGYPVPMAPGTQGATDRAIGKWLKSCFWTREQVVISTKVCGYNERYTWFRESGEGTPNQGADHRERRRVSQATGHRLYRRVAAALARQIRRAHRLRQGRAAAEARRAKPRCGGL